MKVWPLRIFWPNIHPVFSSFNICVWRILFHIKRNIYTYKRLYMHIYPFQAWEARLMVVAGFFVFLLPLLLQKLEISTERNMFPTLRLAFFLQQCFKENNGCSRGATCAWISWGGTRYWTYEIRSRKDRLPYFDKANTWWRRQGV